MLLLPAMKSRQGNVLHLSVSVHRREGVSISGRPPWTETVMDRDPLDRDPPWTEIPPNRDHLDRDPHGQRSPQTETTWTETPWTETPWTETPMDRDPLDRDPHGQRSLLGQRPPKLHTVTSGRYISYWNAFLLRLISPWAKANVKAKFIFDYSR